MSKTLVLYVFHIFNDNVEYFIKNGIFYDIDIDFIIISNDKSNDFKAPSYVKKFFRDNKGYDFGGWSDALLTYDLYKYYDNFIFLNSSVIGPYTHPSFKGKWTDIYLNGLKDDVKLFGSTISAKGYTSNIKDTLNSIWDKKHIILTELTNKHLYKLLTNIHKPHVQSYIFCMNKDTLEYLIKCGIFTKKYTNSFFETVSEKEFLMSKKILEKGWNIGCLLTFYKDIDFRDMDKYNFNFLGDVTHAYYENDLWSKQEVVFVKNNRNSNIQIYHLIIVLIIIIIVVLLFRRHLNLYRK